MRARLTSSRFVGRTGELAELELALGEAARRCPVLVLIGGESGIGKSRLVAEFERRIAGEGVVVLRGEGIDQAEGELPYAPLLSALRPLVRHHHPALAALTPGARAQLAALLPALGDGGSSPDGHDPAGQLRLFEALLELFDVLSDPNPLVLVLEDMHWADRSTRSFAQFIARSLREERVMLLLTYRTDELHRRHALRPLLAELERLDRAHRIDLEPFDRIELAEALTDILGGAPDEVLVERLFGRSEGNPLYTEELLAAGLDGRGAAPKNVQDAFMLRIERLSTDAQAAVRAIAIGQRLDHVAITAMTGIDGDRLQGALREAVAEQVLVAGEDDLLAFRHALLREALYDDLLPGERGQLHLALAGMLEAQGPPGERDFERAATIARHYAAAGDQRAALRATVAAASAANCAYAHAEAAALAERALELWPRVTDASGVVGIDHIGLLTMAADAHDLGHDRNRGEHLLEHALREFNPGTDPRRYSALLMRLARVRWSLNQGESALACAQRALSLLPAGDPGHERVAIQAWLARVRCLRGRYRDAVTDGEEALAAAVAIKDRHAEAEILNTLGMARMVLGDVDEGVMSLRRAVEISRELDDMDALTDAYANLADLLSLSGRSASALATALEGLAAVPSGHARSHNWLLLTVSELAFETGNWELARTHLGAPPARLVGLHFMFRHLREAELALGVGDEDLAASCLEAIEAVVAASSEPQWHGAFGALTGELHRRRGDLAGARRAVEEALDRMELCTDDVMRIARVTAVGLGVEADRALRARDLHDGADARDALARARIHIQRLEAAAESGGPVEAAWLAIGAAQLARATGGNDAELWRRAAQAWDELARPYPAALARWREAEALIEDGDREAAAPVLRAASETARGLGAGWLADELMSLSGRARLDLSEPAAAPADSGPEPEATDPFGLTPRERQVLALVAQGATNRQIGATLYMAEKTASVHVSRILGKLGVQTRGQAAAVAHRQQLA
ncbi:MAG TPA: AAA family ATPase [Solirubrobacteraceae bacterium]|nr:AAA family ATPase [Solirubrobacteraceae bacterium]